jgi:2,4-dienoyl-CoA reductase-like NADH-dependent reductase (Old Yellow Enzyme family)
MTSYSSLFSPARLGTLSIVNRIVMAPLTRARATEAHVPTPIMAEYYRSRADCGLIISEATAVDPMGMGWYRAPGIWSPEMVVAWNAVTDAVHSSGGRMFLQLWHMGRLVLPDYIGGELPIGPSAIAGEGETFAPRPADANGLFLPMKPYVVPREMTQSDIDAVVAAFAKGARNAVQANFDGVEVHGANGYIIDQFLQSKTNHRSDAYGGSIENRLRFLREILEAIALEVEPGRIGLRISPTSERKGMGDSDPAALARAIGSLAREVGLAYIHLIEPIASGFMDRPDKPVADELQAAFGGDVIQNGSFDAATANSFIEAGKADAISFGRPFIANPDLVSRFRKDLPLAEPDFDYAYVGDARGYTDYPDAD